ncbi:hypothetical protein [Nocardia sp. NPDC020380]|uniref:LppU/SCO3897 family protein n=1 Tax=Nocardia sp. NPDC020380 TaxID=3364309 RepID=UPI0037BCBF03
MKKSGDDSFDSVSCSGPDAAFVVLDRAGSGHLHQSCVDVAGTEYDYYDSGDGGEGAICVGTKGADTAHAVNSAQKGDCLTDTNGSNVQKVDCNNSRAIDRVLDRRDTTSFMPDAACSSVAGTQSTYSYVLKAKKGIGAMGTGVVFCLIPKGSDATRTVDNAKVGDCLKKLSADDLEVTDCASPDADYKILNSLPDKSFCDRVSGTIATYSYQRPGTIALPAVLCLGAAR